MKKLCILLLLIPFLSNAQVLVTNPPNIVFNPTNVGTRDSLSLTITNTSNVPVNVTNIKFYTIYNNFPFSASENNFTLAANGSRTIQIYFEPEHNIINNSELVIQHNANSGFEAVDVYGQGVFPNPYYNITQNLSEQALKNALKTRTGQGYTQLSYNAARDNMFMTIDNKRNNGQNATVNRIECVYTGFNKSSYTSRSDAQTTTPNFNTEHTFPQGFFSQTLPMRSDLHHLFPTTNNSNSERGNKPFGVVTGGTPVTLGGGSFYNNTTFEPRNFQKGRTARAMMYFVIRYQDYANHFSIQETILRNWHNTFAPDSIEERRNNDIFLVQNNRNPFVDYPQLEERITNFVSNSVATPSFGLDILQTSINYGTVAVNDIDTFDYVLVNRGNQNINITNAGLSDTSILSFAGTITTLPPGESLEIRVVLQTNQVGQVRENLTFNTNIPGAQSSFSIPIRANAIVTSIEENTNAGYQVYPNPMGDFLTVEGKDFNSTNIKLYNSLSQEVMLSKTISKNTIQLNTSSLIKGIYFLIIEKDGKAFNYKLVK